MLEPKLGAALLLAGLNLAAADVKPVLLGAKEVGFRVDRDEILVGVRDGLFSKLLLEVQHNDLEMLRVVVTYGNGLADTIPEDGSSARSCSSTRRSGRYGRDPRWSGCTACRNRPGL